MSRAALTEAHSEDIIVMVMAASIRQGYYQTEKVYYIQTNLFDAKTEKLIWSAQSKTYEPSSLDDFLQGYEKAISEQMVKDGLVAPSSK